MDEIEEHLSVIAKLDRSQIRDFANLLITTLKNGNRIFICGNGGSAADSQHFAAELSGRFKKERLGLKAIALTTDTSALTAIGNDFGYEFVFSRQLEANGNKGDAVVLITTSGNSLNLVNAAKKAKEMGISSLAFLGRGGGKLKSLCNYSIVVPSENTPRIQEAHELMMHMISQMIDDAF